MMAIKTAWKFLRTGMISQYDKSKWTRGKWRVETARRECEGLNASIYIPDALRYVRGEILAKVEYDDSMPCFVGSDKITTSKMRVVKTWKWTTKMLSVKLAVKAAELALPIWKAKYPDDDRPQKAIDAARMWIKNPTMKNAANAAAYAYIVSAYANIKKLHNYIVRELGK